MKINFLLILITFVFSFASYALPGYRLGSNATIQVNEFNICKSVVNSSQNVFFIPTGVSSDWSAFIAHPPAGISFLSCLTYAWIPSGWSSCSSACNGGMQSQSVVCKDSNNIVVANSNCTGVQPPLSQACNVGVTPNCSNAPDICAGSVFSSANSCNSPQCIGTKPISPAYWSGWSTWSGWNDPGPAACNASCFRTQSQTRSRACIGGNGCGASNCSSPDTVPGGIDTQLNSQNISCSPGEGACPDNVCDNAVPGKRCPGFVVRWVPGSSSLGNMPSVGCSDCMSKSCHFGAYNCSVPLICN